jgi:hypothetical protein
MYELLPTLAVPSKLPDRQPKGTEQDGPFSVSKRRGLLHRPRRDRQGFAGIYNDAQTQPPCQGLDRE